MGFPEAAGGPAEDLIKQSCRSTPYDRLPMRLGGTQNVKKHPWYEGFDWQAMFDQTMDPPYQPAVKDHKDLSNFPAVAENQPPHMPYKDPETGWDNGFDTCG